MKTIKKSMRKNRLLCILAAAMLLFLCPQTEDVVIEKKETTEEVSSLEVHFLDVGQGDATLIVCAGEAMLIDAGDDDKGSSVWMYLQKQGVGRLSYVIGTHPDADHIGGLDVILTKFDCGTIIMPDVASDTAAYRDVAEAMRYGNYRNTLPAVGDSYALGDAVFTVVAPNGRYDDDNNSSVAVRLVHGENVFLFTGDCEAEGEADILQNGIDIGADVLKVGHHGSATSTGSAFLDAVSPAFAVISCGADNPYGHPHRRTLDVLRDSGVKVFRTDLQGTVVAASDGKSIRWNMAPWDMREVGDMQEEKNEGEEGKDKGENGEAPVAVTYVLNRNTGRFHRPDCDSAADISDRNREESSCSREEILSQGYVPCKVCRP